MIQAALRSYGSQAYGHAGQSRLLEVSTDVCGGPQQTRMMRGNGLLCCFAPQCDAKSCQVPLLERP